LGSSGLHEELGIDATMALADPQSIRFEQRVKAGQAEIIGTKFESLAWLQDLGCKVADLRARVHRRCDQRVPGDTAETVAPARWTRGGYPRSLQLV
jgi:hypothetical protein